MGLAEAMSMVLALLILLGFAGICAWLARSRGRDSVIWGILGFFFTVLALATLLFFFKRKGCISEQKIGVRQVVSYVCILLLALTAWTIIGRVIVPGLPEVPDLYPTLAAESDHCWQGNATAEQLDLICELCGTELSAGELLEQISPQTLQALPESLIGPLYEEPVQWLSTGLDESMIDDAIEAILDEQGYQKVNVFYYYIGSYSKETLNGNPTLSSEYEDTTLIVYEDVYRLSVYTGE